MPRACLALSTVSLVISIIIALGVLGMAWRWAFWHSAVDARLRTVYSSIYALGQNLPALSGASVVRRLD